MPYYPVWSLVMIAFNVFVIWALAASSPTTEGTAQSLTGDIALDG